MIPALTYETFGMITLEAFARQTPVIARDIGPLPEVVNESGGGLLFRNDAELRQALERLSSDASLRDELSRRGHAAFLAKWTREAHLAGYFDLIAQTALEKFGQASSAGARTPEPTILEEAIA